MIPILSIVGKSDTGKTTLIEKLLPELVRRGHRVATVKHDVHGFEVDREGKDSWRHKQAGAHTVVLSSPARLTLIRDVDHDLSLEEIRRELVRDVDLILSEGYKRDVQPKIEVFRREKNQELLCTRADNLVAIVADCQFELGVPVFDLDDTAGLADFIETRFLRPRSKKTICLAVDGRPVPLNAFVRDFFAGAIRGMMGALKDCDPAGTIDIHLERTFPPADPPASGPAPSAPGPDAESKR